MPPPLPQWKKQLNMKLDTYRSRQQARQEAEPQPEPKETEPVVERPTIRRRANVIAFQSREENDDAPATTSAPDQPTPSGREKWRKVEQPSSKLPPLIRNGGNQAVAPQIPRPEAPPAATETPEPAPPPVVRSRTAPVRARVIASVMDLAVVLLALGLFIGVAQTISNGLTTDAESLQTLFSVFLGLLFFYWTFYLRYIGETAGMTWMRLRILTFEGKRPTSIQMWIRTAGTILSCCAAGLGFFWALADEDKLTWHDRMSRTYVTDGEPPASAGRSRVRLARPRSRPLPRAARRA